MRPAVIAILFWSMSAFGQCMKQTVFDWHGGANGAALSTAGNLQSCYIGTAPATIDSFGAGPSAMVFDNSVTMPLQGPINLCTGGSSSGANTLSVRVDTTTGLNHCFNIWPATPNTNVMTASVWITNNFTASSALNNDFFTILAVDNTFENVLWAGNDGAGHLRLSQEGGETSFSHFIIIPTNTLFLLTIRLETAHNSPTGSNYIWAYDVNHNILGEMNCKAYSDSPPARVLIGSSDLVNNNNGFSWWYGALVIDADKGKGPLMSGDVTNYYTSTTGRLLAAGSIGDPLKGIGAALSNAPSFNSIVNGDNLFVRGGTYQEGSATVSGPSGLSTARPTTVRSYPGETPAYIGTGNTGRWTYGGVSNMWLQDFVVSNLNQCVVFNAGSHDCVISNCNLGVDGQEILLIQHCTNITVQANTIHDSHALPNILNGEGIYIGTPNGVGIDYTGGIIVRSNRIFNTTSEGTELKENTHDCIIEGNWYSNCAYVDLVRVIEVDEATDWPNNPNHIIRSNVVTFSYQGIKLGTGGSAYNNVLYGITNASFFVENIVPDAYTRNIWHNTSDNSTFLTWTGGATNIVNNLGSGIAGNLAISSAYFVNYSTHDYHLLNGAAPDRAGSPLSASVPTDFDLVTRSVTQPSVGAFENNSVAASSAPSLSLSGATLQLNGATMQISQ